MTFKAGDAVVLKGGSLIMTVEHDEDLSSTRIPTVWIYEGKCHTGYYPTNILRRVEVCDDKGMVIRIGDKVFIDDDYVCEVSDIIYREDGSASLLCDSGDGMTLCVYPSLVSKVSVISIPQISTELGGKPL